MEKRFAERQELALFGISSIVLTRSRFGHCGMTIVGRGDYCTRQNGRTDHSPLPATTAGLTRSTRRHSLTHNHSLPWCSQHNFDRNKHRAKLKRNCGQTDTNIYQRTTRTTATPRHRSSLPSTTPANSSINANRFFLFFLFFCFSFDSVLCSFFVFYLLALFYLFLLATLALDSFHTLYPI